MGTWDVGPFDNDKAADWCGDLDDASPDARQGFVRDTLARAADTAGYLDAGIGDEAVAAAALVAAQCPGGEPAHPHFGPDEPVPDLTGLRALALRALDRVLTEPSELVELWADPDGVPWHTTINGLRETLTPQPPGEQLPESVDRDILEHRTIAAIATIRETLGCTVHQATDILAARYEELRRERPDDFDPGRDEHGGRAAKA